MKENRSNLQSIKVSDATKKILSIKADLSDLYDDVYTFIDERYGDQGGAETRDDFEKRYRALEKFVDDELINVVEETLAMSHFKEI